MSINQHYSSEHSQPQWWPQTHYMMDSSSSSSPDLKPSFCNTQMFSSTRNGTSFDLNNDDDEDRRSTTAHDGEEDDLPKERLFEKPLTPSDVGKLNRLVIPKQHAENCFPMNSTAVDPKGCYLSFEDEAGKSWRFRYSYWNSSQSYVLTKGWSRFVKESRLGAGDIVVFSRHSEDADRFFVSWRRRRSSGESSGGGWIQAAHPRRVSRIQPASSISYQSDCPHAVATAAGSDAQTQNQERKGTSGNSKKLRLFGVNLEYWEAEEEEIVLTTAPMGQTTYPAITTTWT